MLQHFSRLQDEDVSPIDYAAWVGSKFKGATKLTDEEKVEQEKAAEPKEDKLQEMAEESIKEVKEEDQPKADQPQAGNSPLATRKSPT